MSVDPALLTTFVAECQDLFSDIDDLAIALESSPDDMEVIGALFRAVHTLKGGAGTVGLDPFVDFAHEVEATLDRLRQGTLQASAGLVTSLLQCNDVMRTMIDSVVGGDLELASVSGYHEALASLSPSSRKTSSRRQDRVFLVEMAFDEDLQELEVDPTAYVDRLREVGEVLDVEIDVAAIPGLAELEPGQVHATWRVWLKTSAREAEIANNFVLAFLCNRIEWKEVAPPKKVGVSSGVPSAAAPKAAPAIRVATEKLDELLNDVGELLLAVAQATDVLENEGASAERRQETIETLQAASAGIQERALSLRMLPVRGLFGRFRRVVRDLAQQLEKQVELTTEGDATELDKNVIESITDPLKHLVRNAVDHGLESPEVRAASGKDPVGRVVLRAEQRAGKIVIEIVDDGGGIDHAKIARKAVEKGVLCEAEAALPSAINAIFMPGFSTADAVTNVSGRGVGLDVVRKNVEAIGGSVEVESTLGVGTTFRLSLPLSLMIVDALLVSVGQQDFAIPLAAVHEQLRPTPKQLESIEGQPEAMCLRDDVVPLIRLHAVFDIADAEVDPTQGAVVVVQESGDRYGLVVDTIDSYQQVVIKSLAKNYMSVPGFSGVTTLGNGDLSLVLDMGSLRSIAAGEPRRGAATGGATEVSR